MSEATTAPAPAPAAVPTARFPLPTGVVTPIELRNHLVKENIAPATMKPQQMYAWVKSPGKTDPFPVKWYDVDGKVYDKQPTDRLTRPGIASMEIGVEWYKRRLTATPTAPAASTADAATADQVAGTADDEITDANTDEDAGDEGDFDEAE
jgi:hypothetical protein